MKEISPLYYTKQADSKNGYGRYIKQTLPKLHRMIRKIKKGNDIPPPQSL